MRISLSFLCSISLHSFSTEARGQNYGSRFKLSGDNYNVYSTHRQFTLSCCFIYVKHDKHDIELPFIDKSKLIISDPFPGNTRSEKSEKRVRENSEKEESQVNHISIQAMMKLIVLLLAFSQVLAHDQQSDNEEMSVTDWIFGKHPEGHHLRDVNTKQGPPPPPHPPRPFSFFFSRKIFILLS